MRPRAVVAFIEITRAWWHRSERARWTAMSSSPPVRLRGVDTTDERGSILTNNPSGLTLVVVEQPGTDGGAS